MSLPAPKRWVIICCPVSGAKQGVQIMNDITIPKMKELGIEVKMILTEAAGHATDLAKEHGSSEVGLICVGGDGTIHEVVDGLTEAGKLGSVMLGILSQGTVNSFYHTSKLPSAAELPEFIKANSHRAQPMMKVTDDSGAVDTTCFEAIYLGIGYVPSKAQQDWRHTTLGPKFGLFYTLFKCCYFQKEAAVEGKLTLWTDDSESPIVIEEEFYWIVICERSPYTGALAEDEMWISYLTLEKTPGFGRLVSAFTPPFEFMSGLTNLMENHVKVKRMTFEKKEGGIGMCMDGDPIMAGKVLSVRHMKSVWNIVGDRKFPEKVDDSNIVARPPTKCAKEWVEKNGIPEGVSVAVYKEKTGSSVMPLFIGAVVIAAAAVAFVTFSSP
mmetsp:Transcript_7503/g.9794  ORF Transcript_7503/g.9794 Transcript_7503/m.9794 type:complete len:383 (+) Transcript_7503:90-1238(+)